MQAKRLVRLSVLVSAASGAEREDAAGAGLPSASRFMFSASRAETFLLEGSKGHNRRRDGPWGA